MDTIDQMMDIVTDSYSSQVAKFIDDTIRDMLSRNGIKIESNDIEDIKVTLKEHNAELVGLERYECFEVLLKINNAIVDRVQLGKVRRRG